MPINMSARNTAREARHIVDLVRQMVVRMLRAEHWQLCRSVNRNGRRILPVKAMGTRFRKPVYTSTGTVSGIPRNKPVTRNVPSARCEITAARGTP